MTPNRPARLAVWLGSMIAPRSSGMPTCRPASVEPRRSAPASVVPRKSAPLVPRTKRRPTGPVAKRCAAQHAVLKTSSLNAARPADGIFQVAAQKQSVAHFRLVQLEADQPAIEKLHTAHARCLPACAGQVTRIKPDVCKARRRQVGFGPTDLLELCLLDADGACRLPHQPAVAQAELRVAGIVDKALARQASERCQRAKARRLDAMA